VPEAQDKDIDRGLREFIEAGGAPIYLGFGSMPAPDPRRLVQLAVDVSLSRCLLKWCLHST